MTCIFTNSQDGDDSGASAGLTDQNAGGLSMLMLGLGAVASACLAITGVSARVVMRRRTR